MQRIASKETLALYQTELGDCETDTEKLDWLMTCFYNFSQKYIIVKIVKSDTWGLILDAQDYNGDCKEYLDLMNKNIIKEWH